MANTKEETLYHALFLARYLSGADLQDGLVYILYELDMPSHNIGYHYVRNAILLFYKDPIHMLLQGIYQTVIEKVNPSASYEQVEQSMRSAIGLTYKNRDPQIWKLYFHPHGTRPPKRPSSEKIFTFMVANFCFEQHIVRIGNVRFPNIHPSRNRTSQAGDIKCAVCNGTACISYRHINL